MDVATFKFVATLVFGGGALTLISFSPIGRALGDRLRGRHDAPEALDAIDHLREEVGVLRTQLGELAERQDFAERMLAQAREKGALPSGGAAQGAGR